MNIKQLVFNYYRLNFIWACKIAKTTITSVMSVCLSVCLEQLGSYWTDFHEIIYFSKICRENLVSLKSDKNNEYFTWRQIYNFLSYHAHFFLEWEMVHTKGVEKIIPYILCSKTYFKKLRPLWDKVENIVSRIGHRWRYVTSTLRAGYIRLQTLRIHNTYWFPTATMVAWTRLNITLYVHRLSSYKINTKVLSRLLIKNKNISTSIRHYFDSVHSLCCCAHL